MFFKFFKFFLLTSVFTLLASSSLYALSRYVDQIPAAPTSCLTCHELGESFKRNAFGLDVETTLRSDGKVAWSKLYLVDSDSDGQSNGAELGDPCGLWEKGQSRGRSNSISAPGDNLSLSSQSVIGCPDGMNPPMEFEPRPYEEEGLLKLRGATNDLLSAISCQDSNESSFAFLAFFLFRIKRKTKLK